MNDTGSIVEFFYNIVPGAIFLFVLQYFSVFNLKNLISDQALFIFVFIVISLFVGFLFQGLTMVVRQNLGLNKYEQAKVIHNNIVYLNAEKLIANFLKSQKIRNIKNNNNKFYLMDSYLRGEHRAFLPTHFSSLFALWANMFFACFWILLILAISVLGNQNKLYSPLVILIVFVIENLSWILAEKLLKSYYDSILNSFYMQEFKRQKKL